MPAPYEPYLFGSFAALFGLAIGSFLNVVICRLPDGGFRSLNGRSHCPKCNAQIRWFDNIPLLSWIALGAKCRDCRAPISFRYPAIEVFCGILFVWAWATAGGGGSYSGALITIWLFLAALLALSVIDIDLRILPDELTIGGMVLAPVAIFAFPDLTADQWLSEKLVNSVSNERVRAVFVSLAGMAAGAGTIAMIRTLGTLWFSRSEDFPASLESLNQQKRGATIVDFLTKLPPRRTRTDVEGWIEDRCIRVRRENEWRVLRGSDANLKLEPGDLVRVRFVKEAMGFGDVKLQGAIGAFVGVEGTLAVLVIASFAGAILGSLNLLRFYWILRQRAAARGRANAKGLWAVAKVVGGAVPFGPYLAIGATVVLLHRAELFDLARRYWLH
ncbi:MAG: prepilin peptidase [Planctomycetota bacterium]